MSFPRIGTSEGWIKQWTFDAAHVDVTVPSAVPTYLTRDVVPARLSFPRRSRQWTFIATPTVVTAPAYQPQFIRHQVNLPHLHRPHTWQVVPPQVNPPYPFQFSRAQSRPIPRRYRPHIWSTVPPQFNPPFPFPPTHATPRPIPRRHRPHQWSFIPPQANPPFIQPHYTPRRRYNFRTPHRASFPFFLPQFNPPYPFQFSRARSRPNFRTPHTRAWSVTQPQFNPPFPFIIYVTRRRINFRLRRGAQFTVPPPQQVPSTNPAIVINLAVTRRRFNSLARRGRYFPFIPSQVNPPYPFIFIRRNRFFNRTTPRRATYRFPLPQFNPPYPFTFTRASTRRNFRTPHRLILPFTPPQQTPPPSTYNPPFRRLNIRRLLTPRRRPQRTYTFTGNPLLYIILHRTRAELLHYRTTTSTTASRTLSLLYRDGITQSILAVPSVTISTPLHTETKGQLITMETTFYIKQNDTLPVIQETLLYEDGSVIDLTSATSVKFTLKNRDTGVTKINKANGSFVDRANGIVKYEWVAADTDTSGNYLREWQVAFGASILTVPNNDSYPVVITTELA